MRSHSANARNRARSLRKSGPDAELRLWRLLRNRRLQQFKFRRQHPIGPYVVDFVCLEKSLVIEVDGGQHAQQIARDEQRTRVIKAAGCRVIRFWDNDVLKQPQSVLKVIYGELGCPSP